MNILTLLLYLMFLLVELRGSCAKKWLTHRRVRSATSLSPSVPQNSGNDSSPTEINIKSKEVANKTSNNCSSSASDAVIRGRPSDYLQSTVRCASSSTCKSQCRSTAQVCRYTLPAVPTTRKFLIGSNRIGNFRMQMHKNPTGGMEVCCYPGGGLPLSPNDFDEEPTKDDPLYKKVLTGELAERIVDRIFQKSEAKGNPVMDSVISETEFKTLSMSLENSMLEREGCCYKLSGELRCFLAFLLLQSRARRKRSCGYSYQDNYDFGSNRFSIGSFSSVNLPVGLFGFQPPPLMNLP